MDQKTINSRLIKLRVWQDEVSFYFGDLKSLDSNTEVGVLDHYSMIPAFQHSNSGSITPAP